MGSKEKGWGGGGWERGAVVAGRDKTLWSECRGEAYMGGHGRWSSLQPFIDVSRTALDTLTPLTKLMFYSF